jgi:aryl-alcohol dehydrogenase
MSKSNDLARDILGAIVAEAGGAFELRRFELESPRADEVLVRVVASGMCHTDIAVRERVLPTPLPAVLGHEGAGVVAAVGDNVRKVAVGDHVVMSFLSCGHCRTCDQGLPASCEQMGRMNFQGARDDGSHALHAEDGTQFSDRFFGQSSFATYAIANERNIVKVRKDAPLELLGPLGCGIQTGAGTVLNALRVSVGASFAAFGAGAVGLSAVMAARVAGAASIIAVDVVPSRLKLALEIGATHIVNARECDPVAAIRAITGNGADFAMDSTGNVAVTRQAVEALRSMGVCAIVGASPVGTDLRLDVNDLMNNCKSIIGVIEGRSVPDLLIPQLIELHLQGRFPFDRLVKFYAFEAINEAAEDSEKGSAIKPILRMPAH